MRNFKDHESVPWTEPRKEEDCTRHYGEYEAHGAGVSYFTEMNEIEQGVCKQGRLLQS